MSTHNYLKQKKETFCYLSILLEFFSIKNVNIQDLETMPIFWLTIFLNNLINIIIHLKVNTDYDILVQFYILWTLAKSQSMIFFSFLYRKGNAILTGLFVLCVLLCSSCYIFSIAYNSRKTEFLLSTFE